MCNTYVHREEVRCVGVEVDEVSSCIVTAASSGRKREKLIPQPDREGMTGRGEDREKGCQGEVMTVRGDARERGGGGGAKGGVGARDEVPTWRREEGGRKETAPTCQ